MFRQPWFKVELPSLLVPLSGVFLHGKKPEPQNQEPRASKLHTQVRGEWGKEGQEKYH